MTKDFFVMWVIQLNVVDQGLFKTSFLLETLKTQSRHQGESCAFVPTSWMCKKQTSVSLSSIESEVISLDAVFRMDGISALDLWDVVLAVLHFSNNTKSSNLGATGNRWLNNNNKFEKER